MPKQRGQLWDTAITLVRAHAECYSIDHYAHDNHLWHMDLLARSGQLVELTNLASTDVHARRRLNRVLRDRGENAELRERAETGDRDALYILIRLLCSTGRIEIARETIEEIDPGNQYAQKILVGFEVSTS